MSKVEKTLKRVLRGNSDANLGFNDLRELLKHLAFVERIRGSHHIFSREGIEEILNLQPKKSKAKPYQVKQVRTVILRYNLAPSDDQDDQSPPESEIKPR